MENCGNNKGRSTLGGATGGRGASAAEGIVYDVCEACGTRFIFSDGKLAHCLTPDQRPAPPKTTAEDKKPHQASAGITEYSFRTMLRQGNKILERVTRNVASAFGGEEEEEEEDIDRAVEDYKKAQLEKKNKS